jgi:Tol biopolymer transport system component
LAFTLATAALSQAPKGLPANPAPDEVAAQKALAGKANGFVVWSSSRDGNHKIYSMSPDGSNLRKITSGNKTDWYPRISPDGKQVLFTRS